MPNLGEWLPDLPPYGHAGLTVARNVYASTIGYKPIKALSAVTTALPYTWRGGGSFINTDGTTSTLAGTDSGLYAYSGSWTQKYAGTYSSKWAFAQFGSTVIGVNGGAPVKYSLPSATGALLGGSPPSSSMIAIVRDFVFLAGNPSANSTVYWSGINAPEGWTIGTNQCDVQPLPDGGAITGLAGGEYGLVFQESSIHRFTYVGSPVIFQRDKISDAIGCVAPGSVATFGRNSFFLSPRGFYAVMDGQITPIGEQKVNATFWSFYSRSDVQTNIRTTIDPKRTLVIWSMPDRLWIYNWVLDRWTDAYIPGVFGLSTGINSSVSLEGIDALFPSGIDSVTGSLDDPIYKGGDPLLTLVKTDNVIYSLGASSNLAATLTFPILEPFKGRNTRVRRARLDADVTAGVTLTIGYAGRLGDTFQTVAASAMTDTGYIPVRVTEQFLQPQIDFSSGSVWSYAQGVSFDWAPGGSF